MLTTEIDREIDRIYEEVNQLLVDEEWEDCNEFLMDVDCSTTDITLLIAWLTITAAAKSKLNYRETFYQKVAKQVDMVRGRGVAKKLLSGLE